MSQKRAIAVQHRTVLEPKALLAVKGRTAATTEVYRGAVRRFVSWAGEHSRPLGIPGLAEYVDVLRSGGASAAWINLVRCSIKAALMQAALRGGMDARELMLLKSAIEEIPGDRVPLPDIKVVSTEERKRLFEGMPARVRLIARFLYATGCRVSEALAVRYEDCKADGERIVIRLHGKARKERFVRIPAKLLKQIDREFDARRSGTRVFLFQTRNGAQYLRQYVYREIARASRRILGRKLGPHVMRKSRASDLHLRTRDLKGVSEFLGHSDVSTTARLYVRSRLTDADLFADLSDDDYL